MDVLQITNTLNIPFLICGYYLACFKILIFENELYASHRIFFSTLLQRIHDIKLTFWNNIELTQTFWKTINILIFKQSRAKFTVVIICFWRFFHKMYMIFWNNKKTELDQFGTSFKMSIFGMGNEKSKNCFFFIIS